MLIKAQHTSIGGNSYASILCNRQLLLKLIYSLLHFRDSVLKY